MNIEERASWLAEDFREGLGLDGLSNLGTHAMASILRVQFRLVAEAARKNAYQPVLAVGLIGFGLGVLTSATYVIYKLGGW